MPVRQKVTKPDICGFYFLIKSQLYVSNKKQYATVKFLYFRTTVNYCNLNTVIRAKRFYHGVIPPNDENGIANSEDPDQTAPLGAV